MRNSKPRLQDYSITVLRKRLLAVSIVVAILFFFLVGRFFYVQVVWQEELNYRALDQWTREIPIIATRGQILDCNGVVLVDNDDTYSVFVRKKAVYSGLCEKERIEKFYFTKKISRFF